MAKAFRFSSSTFPLNRWARIFSRSSPLSGAAESWLKAPSSAMLADIAMEAGDSRAANIALLGAFSTLSAAPLNSEDLEKILAQRFQGKVLELNRRAFAMGREAAQKGGAV